MTEREVKLGGAGQGKPLTPLGVELGWVGTELALDAAVSVQKLLDRPAEGQM